jgi:hypothetical protein
MPVLNAGGYPDGLAWREVARGSVGALHDTATGEDNEQLFARMGVPDCSAPRREAHFVGAHAVVAGAEDAGDPDAPRVPLWATDFEGRWRSESRCRWFRHADRC